MVAFLGVLGFQLVAANTHVMNYDKSIDAMSTMLGFDIEKDDNGEISDPAIELEGIRNYLRRGTISAKEIDSRVQRVSKALINRRRLLYENMAQVITPTQRLIYGSKPRFDAVTQKMLANRELIYTDGFLYYTKEYQNISGNNLIIHSNDTIGVGYSNLLENGIVPKGNILAATFLGFLYNSFDSATHTLFTKTFDKAYTEANFHNAEIEVLLNGRVEVTVPVFMMQEKRRFKNTSPSEVSYGINLEKPILVKPDDRLNFNLKMAEGAAVTNAGTLRTGVRFVLAGSATRTK